MKILDLPLKAKWYDMIESGVKTEEYREVKPYWEKRLLNYKAIKANARGIAFKKYFLGLKFDTCVQLANELISVLMKSKVSYGELKLNNN